MKIPQLFDTLNFMIQVNIGGEFIGMHVTFLSL